MKTWFQNRRMKHKKLQKKGSDAGSGEEDDVIDAEEVIAMTVQRNTASWGLMQRLGMRRRDDLDFDNAEFDKEDPVIIVYSVDRASWTAHRG